MHRGKTNTIIANNSVSNNGSNSLFDNKLKDILNPSDHLAINYASLAEVNNSEEFKKLFVGL
jgi:hypothetical protein